MTLGKLWNRFISRPFWAVWTWFWGHVRPLWDRLAEWWWRKTTPRVKQDKEDTK